MRDKTKKYRAGSKTYGRGWRKSNSGSRGGTGKGGNYDHKRCQKFQEFSIKKRPEVNFEKIELIKKYLDEEKIQIPDFNLKNPFVWRVVRAVKKKYSLKISGLRNCRVLKKPEKTDKKNIFKNFSTSF